jgi:2-C-methyl-D-erythritol 2,4-cyclodiphosphate synthase
MSIRVGLGFDSHPLVPRRRLLLGGVRIDHPQGLSGHSDGDALAHALTDALLGAAALGDIGQHFPASEPRYKDADSMALLKETYGLVLERGLRLVNADATIYADAPRLGPYREAMCASLAEALHTEKARMNVKFKTLEGLTPPSAAPFIAAHVIVSLESANAENP